MAFLAALLIGKKRSYQWMLRCQQLWGRGTFFIFGCRLSVENMGNVRQGSLIIANHRSPLDIAILLNLFGGHFVSRHDLADWPVVGWAAGVIGTIFVNRSSSASGAAAVRSMSNVLRSGKNLLVFPEGKTCAGDEVLAFRRGAFLALETSGAHGVIPVGLAYDNGLEFTEDSFKKYLWRVTAYHKPRVVAVIGASMVLSGNATQSAHAAHDMVQDLVRRARAKLECDQPNVR